MTEPKVKTKKKPGGKPREPEEWNEKKILVWLRSALRSASRRYPPLYAALAAAKEPYNVPKDDPAFNARQRFSYRCADCNGLFPGKGVSIDHIVDCGSLLKWEDLQGFASRLLCQPEGLQILCSDCHDLKTLQSKNGMSKEEAQVHKTVLKYEKEHNTKEIVALLEKHQYIGCTNAAKRRAALTDLFTKQAKEKEYGTV